jgi:hypothetical protein
MFIVLIAVLNTKEKRVTSSLKNDPEAKTHPGPANKTNLNAPSVQPSSQATNDDQSFDDKSRQAFIINVNRGNARSTQDKPEQAVQVLTEANQTNQNDLSDLETVVHLQPDSAQAKAAPAETLAQLSPREESPKIVDFKPDWRQAPMFRLEATADASKSMAENIRERMLNRIIRFSGMRPQRIDSRKRQVQFVAESGPPRGMRFVIGP